MEEELKQIEATLESLYEHCTKPDSQYDLATAQRFLTVYEEYEITTDGFMKPDKYADYLILHYITDNWDNNLKFMWGRVPPAMRKDKLIKKTWEIGQMLLKSQFLEAAAKINEYTGSNLDGWLDQGYKYLMNKLISKVYSSIDDATRMALMGFKSAKDMKSFMEIYGDGSDAAKTDIGSVEISEAHMRMLKTLVSKFIEKESATQLEREA